MKTLRIFFVLLHAVLAALFAGASLLLMGLAATVGWSAFEADSTRAGAQQIIEATGLMAASVVALQISQTITEEEILRSAHVSAPTRVRRFMSRFLVVVVVALAIEALVSVFRAGHEGLEHLWHAAALVLAVGALLAGWGVFIRLNRYAEELEPEAMQEAKREDQKLK